MDFLNTLIVLWLSANPSLYFVAVVVSPNAIELFYAGGQTLYLDRILLRVCMRWYLWIFTFFLVHFL